MQSIKRLKMSILLSLALFNISASLSGCAGLPTTVDVDDHTLYYLKEADASQWVTELHFLTTGTSDLSQDQWNAISTGQVCMELSDWSDINKMISSFCSAPHIDCNYQIPSAKKTAKEVFNDFFERLEVQSEGKFQRILIK